MTTATYSIAEARDKFTTLIRQAEQAPQPIHITRRGQQVAVVASVDTYKQHTTPPQLDFWEAYMEWRAKWMIDEWEDDEFDPFADVRDRSPGREVNVWA